MENFYEYIHEARKRRSRQQWKNKRNRERARQIDRFRIFREPKEYTTTQYVIVADIIADKLATILQQVLPGKIEVQRGGNPIFDFRNKIWYHFKEFKNHTNERANNPALLIDIRVIDKTIKVREKVEDTFFENTFPDPLTFSENLSNHIRGHLLANIWEFKSNPDRTTLILRDIGPLLKRFKDTEDMEFALF